jgi:hypothetical protein
LESVYFPSEEVALITVISIEGVVVVWTVSVVGVGSTSVASVGITESRLVVSVISSVVVELSITLSLGFGFSLPHETPLTKMVGVVSVGTVGIGVISSRIASVGRVSRVGILLVGVVIVEVLSLSLGFGLSLSLSLENTTVVEVVEVRAVGISGGVRISSVTIGLISSSVGSVSVSAVVILEVLSISLGFSLSFPFAQSMDSWYMGINLRLIDMVEGVNGIGICWSLDFVSQWSLDFVGHWSLDFVGREVSIEVFSSIKVSGVLSSKMLDLCNLDTVSILRNDSPIVMLDKTSSEMLGLRLGNNRKDKEGSKNNELHCYI